jgi:hypothetical protein
MFPHFAARPKSHLKGGAAALAMPSGASAIWDVANYVSSPRVMVKNSVVGGTSDQNLLNAPRRTFAMGTFWNLSLASVTDNNQTAPDGSAEASTVTSADAATQWFIHRAINLPAGTYTAAISAKSLSGVSQTFDLSTALGGTRQTCTATAVWQRFTHTVTVGAGGLNVSITSPSPIIAAANLAIADFELFAGSADLNPNPLSARPRVIQNIDCVLGSTNFDTGMALVNGLVPDTVMGSAMFPALNLGAFTVIAAIKPTAAAGPVPAILSKQGGTWPQFVISTNVTNDSLAKLGPYYNGAQLGLRDLDAGQGTTGLSGSSYFTPGSGMNYLATRYDGTKMGSFLNGVKVADGTYATAAPSITEGLIVNGVLSPGALNSGYSWGFVAVYQRALTDAEVRTATQYLMSKFGTPGVRRILGVNGDSLTQVLPTYQSIVGPNLNPKRHIVAVSIGGSDIASATIGQAPIMDAMITESLPQDEWVLSIWLGTNDLAQASHSASTVIADLGNYVNARKAAGWQKIVVGTILSRLPPGLSSYNQATFDAARATINTAIRGWVGSGGSVSINACADVASDANIGIDGAAANATYFNGDQTHLNATGQGVAETYFRAAYNSI